METKMKLNRGISKQVLLIAIFVLLTCNLSNLLCSVNAQDSQVSEGQQLRLTPIGPGSNSNLQAVEGIFGPYFPENWQYIQYQDSRYLRANYQHESDTDTYELSDHDSAKQFGSIYSIELVIRYLKSGWGQGIAGAIYINDTLYNTEEKVTDAGSDDGIYRTEMAYNPVTGEPWTWDDIDTLEAGVTSYIGSLGSHADIDQVYVTVNYGLDATIFTNPPDCNVTLEDVTLNSGSDGATFTGLATYSTYNVTVSKQYYYSATETIYINDTNIQSTISLAPSQYRLTVTTNPENCKVLIDGVEQTSGWFPENTQHKIQVLGDFYYNSKEETVTVGNYDTTVQVTLTLSPVPFIVFGLIGLVIVILIIIAFKNRQRIAQWNEARKIKIAQLSPEERAERKRNITMIPIIVIFAILVAVIFFLGGGIIGLAVALLNLVGFMVFGEVWTGRLDVLGLVAILFLGGIAVLYAWAGSFWGPATLIGIDAAIFALFALGSSATNKSTSGGSRGPAGASSSTSGGGGGGYVTGVSEPRGVRTCAICGRPLRTRRAYCYECRPWGTRSPKEEDEPTAPIWESREGYPKEPTGGRGKTYEELVGDSKKSYEDLVGKRKKRRYF